MGRKSSEQEKVITNLEKCFNSIEEVTNFFRDYAKMMLDARYNVKQNETEQDQIGLKILTPEQIIQRLPIALAQVKAGNNSENLLNEVREIFYSLYESKDHQKSIQ